MDGGVCDGLGLEENGNSDVPRTTRGEQKISSTQIRPFCHTAKYARHVPIHLNLSVRLVFLLICEAVSLKLKTTYFIPGEC